MYKHAESHKKTPHHDPGHNRYRSKTASAAHMKKSASISADTQISSVKHHWSFHDFEVVDTNRVARAMEGGADLVAGPDEAVPSGRGVLGVGAFGMVKRVRHKSTGCQYALKIIDKFAVLKRETEIHLDREMQLQYETDHPNILKLHDHFENEHYIYMLLDLCEGGHLWSYMRKHGGRLEEGEARKFFYEVCQGILHLHLKGILHRDLKPENLLLSSDGAIKICDFGWSARLSAREFGNASMERTTLCGTLDYVAPEMLRGEKQKESLDVWSLGVLLHEMLTGRPPFQGKNHVEFVSNVIAAQVKRPKEVVNAECWNLLQRMLRSNPSDRITLKEVLEHPWLAVYKSPSSHRKNTKSLEIDNFCASQNSERGGDMLPPPPPIRWADSDNTPDDAPLNTSPTPISSRLKPVTMEAELCEDCHTPKTTGVSQKKIKSTASLPDINRGENGRAVNHEKSVTPTNENSLLQTFKSEKAVYWTNVLKKGLLQLFGVPERKAKSPQGDRRGGKIWTNSDTTDVGEDDTFEKVHTPTQKPIKHRSTKRSAEDCQSTSSQNSNNGNYMNQRYVQSGGVHRMGDYNYAYSTSPYMQRPRKCMNSMPYIGTYHHTVHPPCQPMTTEYSYPAYVSTAPTIIRNTSMTNGIPATVGVNMGGVQYGYGTYPTQSAVPNYNEWYHYYVQQ